MSQIEKTMTRLIDSQNKLIDNLNNQIGIQKLMIELLRETNQKHMETIKSLTSVSFNKTEEPTDIHQADVPLTECKVPNCICKPLFHATYCSQCGKEFGPGNHGYSFCDDHIRMGLKGKD